MLRGALTLAATADPMQCSSTFMVCRRRNEDWTWLVTASLVQGVFDVYNRQSSISLAGFQAFVPRTGCEAATGSSTFLSTVMNIRCSSSILAVVN